MPRASRCDARDERLMGTLPSRQVMDQVCLFPLKAQKVEGLVLTHRFRAGIPTCPSEKILTNRFQPDHPAEYREANSSSAMPRQLA